MISKYRLMVVALSAAGTWTGSSFAQTCLLSVAGLNKDRQVMGPVCVECSWPRAPFGNWGVTSNFGHKEDGRQFEGWYYTDGKYQWNSCTCDYPPPNCSYYNWANCTQQVCQWQSIDVVGTVGILYGTSCPYDSNDDGMCDQGGCLNVWSYTSWNNWMTLYELDDWFSGDDLVQSVYYPSMTAYLNCDVWGCQSAGSAWQTPSFYDTPSSPALVYAQMSILVNYGMYQDSEYCQEQKQWDPRYNCY